MSSIPQTRKKDRELKVIVRDSNNWALIPVDSKMNNPSSKWKNIVSYRFGLLECAKHAYLPQEVIESYNELLKKFKPTSPYVLEQDKDGGEYHIKLVQDGKKTYIYSHRNKDRITFSLFEYLLKSKVLAGLSIEQALKEFLEEIV